MHHIISGEREREREREARKIETNRHRVGLTEAERQRARKRKTERDIKTQIKWMERYCKCVFTIMSPNKQYEMDSK